MIQGMGAHHQMWDEPLPSELAGDFEVIAYDHRGIGESGRADEPYTVADLAEDAHVFGISLGGMTGHDLAPRHPDRVRTLALGCTSPGGPVYAPRGSRRCPATTSSGCRGWDTS